MAGGHEAHICNSAYFILRTNLEDYSHNVLSNFVPTNSLRYVENGHDQNFDISVQRVIFSRILRMALKQQTIIRNSIGLFASDLNGT